MKYFGTFIHTYTPDHLAMKYIHSHLTNWPTPAESLYLNPIEMMWHQLKSFLRRIIKPKNKDELVNGICQFWETVTQTYIGHLGKVVPKVVEREGKASGY